MPSSADLDEVVLYDRAFEAEELASHVAAARRVASPRESPNRMGGACG
ncbi:MAG: hypothetical protein SFX73_15915 [Kofleriaceae bacterium]|nr:hypothetical protein [Kofleriaceae bacterium]